LVKSTTTDANGNYLFSGLCAGTYTVSFHTPVGYTRTLANQSCNVGGQPSDASDSDCDCTTGDACGICVTLPTAGGGSQDLTIDCGYIPACDLTVTKECLIPPAPPAPFNCSDAKPIDTLKVKWNGSTSPIWVKAWNGNIGSGTPALFGPVATGNTVTFTRSGTFPNDTYFELFTDAARTVKLGTSTFHLSCSDIDMNGPEDCGKAAGDGKARAGFINDWIFEGLAGNGQVLSCTPPTTTGSDVCTVLQAPLASCETSGKPTSLTFLYNGGGCGNPDNNNPQSGKFTCSGSVGGAAQVYVRSLNGDTISPQVVNLGGTFTVTGPFDAQSTFVLSNNVAGGSKETLSIHTSCSQRLEVGDVFGDMTLVGFNGDTGGSSIIYRYAVHNGGSAPLNNVFLTDDKIGAIAGPFSLAAGETKTYEVPVVVNGTIVNTATATVQGQNCSASSGPVTVNVVPTPEPFVCSEAKPIDTLKVKWNGSTSPIWVKAWNGNIGSGTPALFGPVATGDTVTFTRSGTFPNDTYFELFTDAARTIKLGTSTFHLSCSDEDMNGTEDCGKAAGDGKAKTGMINDWIFVGLAGNGKVLSCAP
jgi:hypothetical protein